MLYSVAMSPEARFRLLVAQSLVDGQLGPPEEALLQRAARGLGLEPGRAVEMVRAIASGADTGGLEVPDSRSERSRVLRELVDVIAADGRAAPAELRCLQAVAKAFRAAPSELQEMLDDAFGAGAVVVPGGAAPVKTRERETLGAAQCPSCGAPVEFKNARSVAVVCEYCDTTVTRTDRGEALREVGKVSHVVDNGSPLRIGASGRCFGVEFAVLGLLQVEHATGYWNEWYLEWADRRTGWLGEALGQYFVTFPGRDGAAVDVPSFDDLTVGRELFLEGKAYTVAEVRRARATGTLGETPFVVEEGYDVPYADLRRSDDGFATIDYSEQPPLTFYGRCVRWHDLGMRGYRRFDGWSV